MVNKFCLCIFASYNELKHWVYTEFFSRPTSLKRQHRSLLTSQRIYGQRLAVKIFWPNGPLAELAEGYNSAVKHLIKIVLRNSGILMKKQKLFLFMLIQFQNEIFFQFLELPATTSVMNNLE